MKLTIDNRRRLVVQNNIYIPNDWIFNGWTRNFDHKIVKPLIGFS